MKTTARRNRTKEEIIKRVSIWQTKFWEHRKLKTKVRVLKTELHQSTKRLNKLIGGGPAVPQNLIEEQNNKVKFIKARLKKAQRELKGAK